MNEKCIGRKIHSEIENPIDDQLIHLCQKCIPTCTSCNITPNHITITRIILSILVCYSLYIGQDIIFPIVGLGLCYFMDCLDGHLARSTNQVTVLGDYLDHFADLFIIIMFVIYLFYKVYPLKKEIITLFVILSYAALVHLSLQQKTYSNNQPELLDNFHRLHSFGSEHIVWTRYFGTGSLIVFMLFVMGWIRRYNPYSSIDFSYSSMS
jgi:phosphatidylglycerophosphate synthase